MTIYTDRRFSFHGKSWTSMVVSGLLWPQKAYCYHFPSRTIPPIKYSTKPSSSFLLQQRSERHPQPKKATHKNWNQHTSQIRIWSNWWLRWLKLLILYVPNMSARHPRTLSPPSSLILCPKCICPKNLKQDCLDRICTIFSLGLFHNTDLIIFYPPPPHPPLLLLIDIQ